MVSKAFSFRLPDEAVQALEALQLEGETLNQTAQRFMLEHLGLSTKPSTILHTPVDIKELIKQEVRSQLEEVRGKSNAR
ncbi:hypothetical protein [Calothrix sp. NIES-2098]|uniref:hypothetical protein n=1 Tax=Calothrix sp. NIES-2098 TaxID=1954171 RepID=UPI000B5F4125|nr:hypothetical protein NIES2098_38190 [Calothrix sp. NIES-2098]